MKRGGIDDEEFCDLYDGETGAEGRMLGETVKWLEAMDEADKEAAAGRLDVDAAMSESAARNYIGAVTGALHSFGKVKGPGRMTESGFRYLVSRMEVDRLAMTSKSEREMADRLKTIVHAAVLLMAERDSKGGENAEG